MTNAVNNMVEPDIIDLCRFPPLYWLGCYGSDMKYRKLVTKESYKHPAKASFQLINRIYEHLEYLGLLKRDDTVVDFMAGTGRINLLAAARGYKTVAVELEPHFIKMIEANKAAAEKHLGRTVDMQVIQGDARNLSKLLEKSGVGVVSPPYSDQNHRSDNDILDTLMRVRTGKLADNRQKDKKVYSQNPLNIGNLRDAPRKHKCPCHLLPEHELTAHPNMGGIIGKLGRGEKLKVGVISPPYSQAIDRVSKGKIQGGFIEECLTRTYEKANHSEGEKNIANLPDKVGMVSPPYAQEQHSRFKKNPVMMKTLGKRKGAYGGEEYSDNPSNIGNLGDKVGVTSPPYLKSPESKGNSLHPLITAKGTIRGCGFHSQGGSAFHKYSSNPLNIGNQNGETYLSAMLQVYNEAYKAGINPLVTITKNPTRNGALRRLDLDTVLLLEKCGYRIVDYHRAVLFRVEEKATATLDGGVKESKSMKGRVSFFKRLSIGKGNVAAQWEDIIFAVRDG